MPTKWSTDAKYKIHRMANLKIAFEFMKKERLNQMNVTPDEVESGSINAILSLLWGLIVRYQICKTEDASSKAQSDKKKEILVWLQSQLSPHGSISIKDFSSSWQSGVSLVALCSVLCELHFDIEKWNSMETVKVCEQALSIGEKQCGIPLLITPALLSTSPDENSILLYLSFFFDKYKSSSWKPKNLDPKKCIVTTKDKFEIGKNMKFIISTFDPMGAPIYDSTAKIDISIKDSTGFPTMLKSPELQDKRDGTYIFEYTIKKGDNSIVFRINGEEVSTISSPNPVKKGPSGYFHKRTPSQSGNDAPPSPSTPSPMISKGMSESPLKKFSSEPQFAKTNTPIKKLEKFEVELGKCALLVENPVVEFGKPVIFKIQMKDREGNTCDPTDLKLDILITKGTNTIPHKILSKTLGNRTVEFSPQSGENIITVKINDQHVPNSPKTIKCIVRCDPNKTKFSGDGLTRCIQSIDTSFFITQCDAQGNQLYDPQAPLQILFATETHFEMIDHQNGLFECKYMATVPGILKVGIKMGTKTVYQSKIQVDKQEIKQIVPDICDLNKSLLKKKDSYEMFTHSSFEIISRGPDGQNRIGKHDDFVVSINGAFPGDSILTKIKDHGDGTYECTFTAQKSGTYQVNVTNDGTPLKGTPFNLEILPPKYFVTGNGLKSGVQERKKTQFFVQPRLGHTIPIKQIQVKVETPSKSETCHCEITHVDDQQVRVEYSANESGPHYFSVFVNNEEIPGSPFFVEISKYVPPKVDPSKSICQGDGISNRIKCGNPVQFIITAVDTSGEIRDEEDPVQVEIVSQNRIIESKVVSNRNGTYTCSYLPVKSGSYVLNVRIGGIHVMNSPFHVDAVLLESHECWKIELEQELATMHAPILLTPIEDVPHIMDPTEIEVLLVNGASDSNTLVNGIVRVENGYLAVLSPSKAGKHVIQVLFDGKDIQGSPITLDIKEGCEPTLTIVEGVKDITMLEKLQISVFTKSKNGHIRKTEGDRVNIFIFGPEEDKFIGEGPGMWYFTPTLQKGAYPIEFIPNLAGKYMIQVEIYDQIVFTRDFMVHPLPWYVHGRGLKNGIPTKKKTSFVVEKRSNNVEKIHDFKCGISAPKNSHTCDLNVTREQSDLIRVEFLPREEGIHQFSIQINGKEIKGNPYIVHVRKDSAHPIKSFISNRNTSVRMGELTTLFSIHPVDLHENVRFTLDDDFLVLIQEPDGKLCRGVLQSNLDGSWDVFMQPRLEGEHVCEVLLDGEQIASSPFKFVVKPPLWEFFYDSNLKFYEKQKTLIKICKNSTLPDIEKVHAILVSPEKKTSKIPCVLKGNHIWELELVPELFGTYQLSIYTNELEISTSPYLFDVLPNVDPSKSIAFGPFNQMTDLDVISIKLLCKDSLGHIRIGMDDHPEVKMVPTPTKCQIVPNPMTGEYLIELVPSAIGKQQIWIQLDGKDIQGSPFTVTLVEKSVEEKKMMEKVKQDIRIKQIREKLFSLIEKRKHVKEGVEQYENRAKSLLAWIENATKRHSNVSIKELGNSHGTCQQRCMIFATFQNEFIGMKREKLGLYHSYTDLMRTWDQLSLPPYTTLPFETIETAWNKLAILLEDYGQTCKERYWSMTQFESKSTQFKSFAKELDDWLKLDLNTSIKTKQIETVTLEISKLNSWKSKFKTFSVLLESFVSIAKEMDLAGHKDSIEMMIKTNEMTKKLMYWKEIAEKKGKELETLRIQKEKQLNDTLTFSRMISNLDLCLESILLIMRTLPLDTKAFDLGIEKLKKEKQNMPQMTAFYKNFSQSVSQMLPDSYEKVILKLEKVEERIFEIGSQMEEKKLKFDTEQLQITIFENSFKEWKEWLETQMELLSSKYTSESEHEKLLLSFENEAISMLEQNSTKFNKVVELFSKLVTLELADQVSVTMREIEHLDAQAKELVVKLERNLKRGLDKCMELLKSLDTALEELTDWISEKESKIRVDLTELMGISYISAIEAQIKILDIYKTEISAQEKNLVIMKDLGVQVLNLRHAASEPIYQDVLSTFSSFEKLRSDTNKLHKDLNQLLSLLVTLERDAIEYASVSNMVYLELEKIKSYLDIKVENLETPQLKLLLEEHNKIRVKYPTKQVFQIRELWNKMYDAGEDPLVFTSLALPTVLSRDLEVKMKLEKNLEVIELQIQKNDKEEEWISKFRTQCFEFVELGRSRASILEVEAKKKIILEMYDLLGHYKLVDRLEIDKKLIMQIYDHLVETSRYYPVFSSYDITKSKLLSLEQANKAASDLGKIIGREDQKTMNYEEFLKNLKETSVKDMKTLFEFILKSKIEFSSEEQNRMNLKKKDGVYQYDAFIDGFFK